MLRFLNRINNTIWVKVFIWSKHEVGFIIHNNYDKTFTDIFFVVVDSINSWKIQCKHVLKYSISHLFVSHAIKKSARFWNFETKENPFSYHRIFRLYKFFD